MTDALISLSGNVKKILLSEWDPIGIRYIDGADGEYDMYIPHLCQMIKKNLSIDEIYKYLRWIEVERLGLDGDIKVTRSGAEKLWSLS
jgi:hypothetical protein